MENKREHKNGNCGNDPTNLFVDTFKILSSNKNNQLYEETLYKSLGFIFKQKQTINLRCEKTMS